MNTRIDRYLLKRTVAMLLRTACALIVLYVLIDLLSHRSADIEQHEVPWRVIVEYYLAMTPSILTNYVAPFAMLIAGLLVLGDTAQHNEVTAALAGGVSLHRFVRMPVVVAAVFAVGILLLQETVGVQAARRANQIENNFFSQSPGSANRGPASWAHLSGKWTCHIMKFNRLALTGENVLMHAFEPDQHEQIEAKRIYWDPKRGQWLLERGWWHRFDPQTEERQSTRITQCPAPFGETPDLLFALDQPVDAKTAGQLVADIERAREQNQPVRRYLVKFHARFAQPALSFVMIWLAIPFAMRIRRGGLAIGFGAAVATAVAYLMLFFLFVGLGQMGQLEPVVAAWAPNAVFLAVGLVLFWRTPT